MHGSSARVYLPSKFEALSLILSSHPKKTEGMKRKHCRKNILLAYYVFFSFLKVNENKKFLR
jgi:hypothetical protein